MWVNGLDSKKIHELYGGRAESENWIENTKKHLKNNQKKQLDRENYAL